MKTNALIGLLTIISYTVQSQTVIPVLTPLDLQGKVTPYTAILKQPHCFFNGTCPDCQIWLVASLPSATSTFDTDSTGANILSLSPYPTAFNPTSKNYFLTKVGPLSAFPCNASSDALYFVVGADGTCSTVNCNGILPTGSTVRFKYLLINGTNFITNQTDWSGNITLITPQNPLGINDGLSGRSAAMIVITSILSVAMALLLLFFFIMLCVVCCRKKNSMPITGKSSHSKPITVKNPHSGPTTAKSPHSGHITVGSPHSGPITFGSPHSGPITVGSAHSEPITDNGTLRIPHYDTHNLKDRVHPYDNPAFKLERKK